MSISYPLSMPTTPGIRKIRMTPLATVAMTESPFTGEQQVFEHQGERWMAEIELPPMKRDQAAKWQAFFAALRGRLGTFLLKPVEKTGQGTASGVTVNGADQTGKSIALSGSGTLKAGDFFQLGSGSTARLHMNVGTDIPLGGTVDIFPRLRESPGNGSSVIVSNPAGLFRLVEPVGWDVETKFVYGFIFKAMEAR